MAVVADFDHLSAAISHATAPAFMLGAVAGFLSVLVGRMERVMDRNRALQSSGADALDPSLKDAIAKSFARRMQLLSRAIYYAVLSALITAALLTGAFVAALVGYGHGGIMAAMFVVALVLLMVSLVELTREIRVHMATMHLD
jgi:2-methylisocitrate lyase-like PEP mutase family enzyme